MKSKLAALTLFTFAFSCKTSKNKVYTIIKPAAQRLETGIIDTNTLNSLNEPMKAVAYYALDTASDLPTAIRSNTKRAAEQLSLVKKYFPSQASSTGSRSGLRTAMASSRNKYFTSLKLAENNDTIIATYTYDIIVDGNILNHSQEDMYVFDGKALKKVN